MTRSLARCLWLCLSSALASCAERDQTSACARGAGCLDVSPPDSVQCAPDCATDGATPADVDARATDDTVPADTSDDIGRADASSADSTDASADTFSDAVMTDTLSDAVATDTLPDIIAMDAPHDAAVTDTLTDVVAMDALTDAVTMDALTDAAVRDALTDGGRGPRVGAIRWDAWQPDASVASWYVSPALFTRHAHREPTHGWWLNGVPDAQAIMDDEIRAAADHGLSYWAFVWYPAGDPGVAAIGESLGRYLASSLRGRIDFALILQHGYLFHESGAHVGEPAWFDAATFRSYFAQPTHLVVDGNRPVVFLFEGHGAGQQYTPAQIAQITEAARAAGRATPVYVQTTNLRSTGLDAITTYFPFFASAAGSGRLCWETLAPLERRNNLTDTGPLVVAGLSPMADPRPRMQDTLLDGGPRLDIYPFWVEAPTRSQWRAHLRGTLDWLRDHPARTTSPPLALVYAWNEIDEGGPGIVPTRQHGAMFLEEIGEALARTTPAVTVDRINGANCAVTPSAARVVPDYFVAGNFDSDEAIVFDGGALELRWAATRFDVRGTRGPNRGVMVVSVDGVDAGRFDTNQPSYATDQLLGAVTGLAARPHLVRVSVASGDARQVGVDSFVATRDAPDAANLARAARFTASSSNAGQGPELAGDGDPSTAWQAALGTASGQWLEARFATPTAVGAAQVTPYDDRVSEWRLEAETASGWALVAQGTSLGTRAQPLVRAFTPTTTRAVRLQVVRSSSSAIVLDLALYAR